MPRESCFTNATIVLETSVIHGHILVRDGIIAAVDEGKGLRLGSGNGGCHTEDMEGDCLIPGLVELHTDNLEKHLEPRPGVLWPSARAAFAAHDVQVAAAGITTVFDSVSVGEHHSSGNRHTMLALAREALEDSRATGRLRSEHRLHLRCELSDPQLPGLFDSVSEEPELGLVSLMDHTPGQRQFTDETAYRTYYRRYAWSDEEFSAHVNRMAEQRRIYADKHAAAIKEFCRGKRLPMASHDDVTVAHVEEAVTSGMVISEFPTTLEAAEYANGRGLLTLMGAPNVLRGGSHSGNVSALQVAEKRVLGGLSSDYVPASLLPGAYLLHAKAGYSLPEAMAMVTRNPAEAVGLNDRGSIAAGKRADLVRVSMPGRFTEEKKAGGTRMSLPEVRSVWREGRQVI